MENQSRPADLPPSKGGRYGGFGNPNCKTFMFSHLPRVFANWTIFWPVVVSAADSSNNSNNNSGADFMEDPVAALSKGFSWFTTNASTAISVLGTKVQEGAKIAAHQAETLGATLNENVLKPTASAIQDPSLGRNVSQYVSTFGERVSKAGQEGFTMASKWIADPSEEWEKVAGQRNSPNADSAPMSFGDGEMTASGGLSLPPPVATSTGYGSTIAPSGASVEVDKAATSPGWDDWNEDAISPPKTGDSAPAQSTVPPQSGDQGWEDF